MKRKILMIAVFAILILASGCTTEDDSLEVICIMPEETTTAQTFPPTKTTSLTPEVTESPEDNVTRWKADGIIEEGEYENNVTGFRDLFYIYRTSDNETLYMGIKGKTSGYVSVGFNPVAMMKNADIILGGNIGTGGSLYIYDMVLPHCIRANEVRHRTRRRIQYRRICRNRESCIPGNPRILKKTGYWMTNTIPCLKNRNHEYLSLHNFVFSRTGSLIIILYFNYGIFHTFYYPDRTVKYLL